MRGGMVWPVEVTRHGKARRGLAWSGGACVGMAGLGQTGCPGVPSSDGAPGLFPVTTFGGYRRPCRSGSFLCMLHRAYSLLEVKSVDESTRTIEGIATTPATDRMDDVVEPMGAEFDLPLPFLMHHDSRSPVGHVTKAKPTKSGIPVTIRLQQTDEPGLVKDRLDAAWADIRLGLVRGLSIGFAPIESADIEGSRWGRRFTRWSWLELSAVVIPANEEATITSVKSFAALGDADRRTPPGASGRPVKLITPKRGANMKTITERIADFEATRAAKAARRLEIQEKAGAEGRSKDEAEREEFDTITDELKSIDAELVDLRELERENVQKARPVAGSGFNGNGTQAASESRGTVTVKAEEKLKPGIEFARYAMCVAAAKGNLPQALELARTHYPQQMRAINVIKAAAERGATVEKLFLQAKAAVAAGTTTDSVWAAPLLAYNVFAGDFLEFLRPQTIIGQFGANGVPDLRRIPFNVHIKGQTSGGTGYWVGEGKPKPVTKFDFNDTYHGYTKVAAIAVLTEELIRFSDPSAEMLVRDAIAGALIERIDTDLVDPAKGLVSGVSPAGLTNGIASIASSGDDAAAVRADIMDLWAAGLAAHLPMTSAVYITTPAIALGLSLMVNDVGGQVEFPNITMNGGTLLGVPVIVSNYVDAGTFILVFANEIWLSDDGGVTVDASREASIQMLDNPTNASDGGTVATTMVSMYQTDSVALRAHRFINWSLRRTTAVRWLHGVSWGGAGS